MVKWLVGCVGWEDFGDLVVGRQDTAGTSDGVRGISYAGMAAPETHSNHIEYVTIGTLGEAKDFGDATQTRYSIQANFCLSVRPRSGSGIFTIEIYSYTLYNYN